MRDPPPTRTSALVACSLVSNSPGGLGPHHRVTALDHPTARWTDPPVGLVGVLSSTLIATFLATQRGAVLDGVDGRLHGGDDGLDRPGKGRDGYATVVDSLEPEK